VKYSILPVGFASVVIYVPGLSHLLQQILAVILVLSSFFPAEEVVRPKFKSLF
jgi:hypothetical protein